MEAQKTIDYADKLARVLGGGLSKEDLASELSSFDDLLVNGRLVAVKEIAAKLWGLDGDPDYRWEDARPDLSYSEKQRLILDAVSVFKAGGDSPVPELFHAIPQYIRFRGERVKIEKVLSEAWGYILFRAQEEEAYYLEVLKNVSAVYYNETFRLTTAQGEDFLARPSYEAALRNPGEPEG